MARGRGAGYLTYTALVLLSSTASVSAAESICAFCDLWKVSIDNGPAPSPEDGPPFSAHANRNRHDLPYEVVGVVGAYIASVLILGTLLLTVGRSLRTKAQSMARSEKPTELVKPLRKAFDPSPVSPNSQRSWYSPRRLKNKKSAASSVRSGNSNLASPAMDSVVSFDANVVEADRQRRQEEMERLYAAVMAHDDRKSQTQLSEQAVQPPEYQQQQGKRPPNLVTDAPALKHLQGEQQQLSPMSPKSPVRAIYPPDGTAPPMPQSATGPIRAEYPTTPLSPEYPRHYQQQHDEQARRSGASSLPSIRSPRSERSFGGKKLRKSLRNIKISAPLEGDDNSDGARTPLSPRFYTDPGIPPEPPTARTVDTVGTAHTADSAYPPTTPGTGRSYRFDEERQEFEEENEDLDEVRDLPQAHPNRLSAYQYQNQAQAVTDNASQRKDPAGTTPQNRTATRTSQTLPFRQMTDPRAAYPLSPATWNQPTSAGPGRTQFAAMHSANPIGGGMRSGLATPYSPYMPFTPITPVTPRLPTRAERKQREKEERQVHGAITEEDQVADDKDLWSSGY